jgi:hypothetical protein
VLHIGLAFSAEAFFARLVEIQQGVVVDEAENGHQLILFLPCLSWGLGVALLGSA